MELEQIEIWDFVPCFRRYFVVQKSMFFLKKQVSFDRIFFENRLDLMIFSDELQTHRSRRLFGVVGSDFDSFQILLQHFLLFLIFGPVQRARG